MQETIANPTSAFASHRQRRATQGGALTGDVLTKMRSRRSAEPCLRFLLPSVTANRLPPYISTPSDESLRGTQGRKGWSNIEEENGLSGGIGLARIVIDNVSDLLLLAVDVSRDVPVVSVERRLGSMKLSANSRLRWRQTLELTQIWMDTPSQEPATWLPWVLCPWDDPGNG